MHQLLNIPESVGAGHLESALRELGEFSYIRSYGNLGDLLIAEATDQYLENHGFKYTIVDPYTAGDEMHNLVHGGGARFTADWCDVDTCIKVLCNEKVRRCVILPSSFHKVDTLLGHFDARHVLFCRDAASYAYCRAMCPESQVYLTDDTAVSLDLNKLQPSDLSEEADGVEEKKLQFALRHYLCRGMRCRMHKATVLTRIGGEEKRVAFLLRTDKEKKTGFVSPMTYDISLSWHTPERNKYNANLLQAFSDVLKYADVIVSDRLHVCIMAYHSGREVYMMDNSYGKLKGVYEQSLSGCPRVHLVQADDLPADLRKAWGLLNAPHRKICYLAVEKIYGMLKRLLRR